MNHQKKTYRLPKSELEISNSNISSGMHDTEVRSPNTAICQPGQEDGNFLFELGKQIREDGSLMKFMKEAGECYREKGWL